MRKILSTFLLCFVGISFAQEASFRPLISTDLNRLHPHARGLFAGWLMNEGNGNKFIDFTGNGFHASRPVDLDANMFWQVHERGYGIKFSAGTGSRFFEVEPGIANLINVPDVTAGLTIVASVFIDSWDERRIISKSSAGSAENDHKWMLGAISSTGNKYRARIETGGSTTTLVSDDNYNLNTWMQVSVVYDNSNIILRIIEEHGSVSRKSTAATGVLASTTNDCLIGGHPGFPDDDGKVWSGNMEYIYLYNRPLTESELIEIDRDPYAMFRQPLYARILKSTAVAAARRRAIIIF